MALVANWRESIVLWHSNRENLPERNDVAVPGVAGPISWQMKYDHCVLPVCRSARCLALSV